MFLKDRLHLFNSGWSLGKAVFHRVFGSLLEGLDVEGIIAECEKGEHREDSFGRTQRLELTERAAGMVLLRFSIFVWGDRGTIKKRMLLF